MLKKIYFVPPHEVNKPRRQTSLSLLQLNSRNLKVLVCTTSKIKSKFFHSGLKKELGFLNIRTNLTFLDNFLHLPTVSWLLVHMDTSAGTISTLNKKWQITYVHVMQLHTY